MMIVKLKLIDFFHFLESRLTYIETLVIRSRSEIMMLLDQAGSSTRETIIRHHSLKSVSPTELREELGSS
jgi:hypothetical protein